MLSIITLLLLISIMNCDLLTGPEDPAADFFGVWRSKKPDNTDHWRLTMEEDMTFDIEEYREGVFVQLADGSWEYDDDTSELTIFIDNVLAGDNYGPPPEGQPEKLIKYAAVIKDRMLLSCLIGGNTETGTGFWEMVEQQTNVESEDNESHMVLSLNEDGTLDYEITSTAAGGPNESCEATYTFDGNQILISGSTDETVLANTAYTYEIVGKGFYFSKLGDYYIFPFRLEE